MWRGIQLFLGVLNFSVVIMAGYFLLHGGVASSQNGQVLEYKDFVSILLTALAVMIATLTIFVAAAAFWGFGSLKEEACKVARIEANSTAIRAVQELNEQTRKNSTSDLGAAAGGDVR